jgi:hypothetical protein
MIQYIIPFGLLIFLIIILIISTQNKKIINESFSNKSDPYLYPIKGLQSICAKDNLKPSFMPKACYVDGNLNSYANCKCEDESGNCKICYKEIKKDSKNASTVYDASANFD